VPLDDVVGVGKTLKSLNRELPNCRQHPKTTARVADEALVDERREDAQVGAADFFSRLQSAAAGENGQAGKKLLLCPVEQVVARLS
jgi:hypothetical protein